MRVVGLDIGGAHLKAADGDGRTALRAFAVWKHPDRLAGELSALLDEFGPVDTLAVTMTAELADCFATKAEGVDRVLAAVSQAAGEKPVSVWQTGAEFVTPEIAREIPLLVAAANWHALATWIGRAAPRGAAILVDVGSTTTDIIPLLEGVPVPDGLTDRDRLQAGELVYSGVRRTPLCAVAHTVPFRDAYCPLAAELFATTLDIYLLLGDIAEDPDNCETANGRPATLEAARDRLARMLCCDRTEVTPDELHGMAAFLADVQRRRIAGALERVVSARETECRTVLTAGSGEFLAKRLTDGHSRLQHAERVSLASILGSRACETAEALARLAAERL